MSLLDSGFLKQMQRTKLSLTIAAALGITTSHASSPLNPVSNFPRQDTKLERAVTNNDNSDAYAGFSFTKLDSQGKDLPNLKDFNDGTVTQNNTRLMLAHCPLCFPPKSDWKRSQDLHSKATKKSRHHHQGEKNSIYYGWPLLLRNSRDQR